MIIEAVCSASVQYHNLWLYLLLQLYMQLQENKTM